MSQGRANGEGALRGRAGTRKCCGPRRPVPPGVASSRPPFALGSVGAAWRLVQSCLNCLLSTAGSESKTKQNKSNNDKKTNKLEDTQGHRPQTCLVRGPVRDAGTGCKNAHGSERLSMPKNDVCWKGKVTFS